jgi:serine/threonine protein kinase
MATRYPCRAKVQLSDFNILGRLGDGSFSTVILAQLRGGQQEQYAIKIVNKHLIMRNKMVDYVRNERNILDQLSHDGVVRLMFTFQDADSLCKWGTPVGSFTCHSCAAMQNSQAVLLFLEYGQAQGVAPVCVQPDVLLLALNCRFWL